MNNSNTDNIEVSLSMDVPGTIVETGSGGRRRIKTPNSIHHLISRIAHRVYFLQEDERNDIIAMMIRAATFTCVDLIGWCVMTNHFHILVRLPEYRWLSEEELFACYRALHTQEEADRYKAEIENLRLGGEMGVQEATERLQKLREKTFSIPWFMKILKEWFSKDYNGRTAHAGTMWEAVYTDRPVQATRAKMAFRMAYIHLNPVRAGIVREFDVYPWSSFSQSVVGDERAIAGLRLIYGTEMTESEMFETHRLYMQRALEHGKRKKALEIALRKAVGYSAPPSPITDAAYVAQAEAHLEEVQRAGVEIAYENKRTYRRWEEREEEWMLDVIDEIVECPEVPVAELANRIGLGKSKTYALVKKMVDLGILSRDGGSKRFRLSEAFSNSMIVSGTNMETVGRAA